ncbi:MAG: spore cortex biosynthesis protein YabQ [Christensenellales bacterium]
MDSTLIQGYIFFCAVYGGLIIGAVYDVLSAIRKILNKSKWVGALLDLAFCIFAAFIILAVLFRVASGQIRAFSLLGFGAGVFLYMLGIRRLLRAIGRRFFYKSIKKEAAEHKKSRKTVK